MGKPGLRKSALYSSTPFSGLGLAAVVVASLAGVGPASACGGLVDIACNFGTAVETAVHQTGTAVETAAHQTGTAVETATHQTGTAVETATHQTGTAVETAVHQTGTAAEIAVHNGGKTVEKGVQDMGGAVIAVGKFTEREVQSVGTTLDAAGKRIREGKIIDAIWHASTDPLKHTQENAAKAAQESDILRTVGQVAATAYGGPGGAAAYAAWFAYNASGGNVDLALRVGVIAGATSAAFSAAGQMPAVHTGEIAQKAIVTGAIGGLGVAVAGGNKEDVQKGFLMAGGMVVAQAIYQDSTGMKEPDGHSSVGPAECMKAAPGTSCSPDIEAYIRDKDGNLVTHMENGHEVYETDVRLTDHMIPHVGTNAYDSSAPFWGWTERSGFMTDVSKIPGMNAMAYFHDAWTQDAGMTGLPMVVTIIPATILTYDASGAPYFDFLENTAIDSSQKPTEPTD